MTPLSVFVPRRFVRLIASDAMNVSRDPMLIFACVLSVLPAIGLSMGRTAIDGAGAAANITNLYAYFVPVALVLPAFLIGWVSGFLLLEDRDDGPLLAVEVTPVGRAGFLAYRLVISATIAGLITAMGIALLLPDSPIWLKVVVLATIPADTVLASLALLTFARNKVEGLALTKLINIAAIIPAAAFIPSPLRLVGAVVPTYWLGELIYSEGIVSWVAVCLLVVSHAAVALVFRTVLRQRPG
jgi:fluoroquinolone transport system permease protein